MNVGIVTPGSIFPGVNVAISELCIRESRAGNRVFGFFEGWRGLNYNLREQIPFNSLRYDGGSILCTSSDELEIPRASEALRGLDKLYCIGERSVQHEASRVANLSDVNVVGLLTSLERDVGFGFNTCVWENVQKVKCAHSAAFAAHAVFFLEMPSDEIALRIGMINPMVDVVIAAGSSEDHTFDVQNAYAIEGKAVVIVSRHAPYRHIVDTLNAYNVTTVVIPLDHTVTGADPCIYDTVLARRMATECHNLGKSKHNFCKTATGVFSYEKNIVVM